MIVNMEILEFSPGIIDTFEFSLVRVSSFGGFDGSKVSLLLLFIDKTKAI